MLLSPREMEGFIASSGGLEANHFLPLRLNRKCLFPKDIGKDPFLFQDSQKKRLYTLGKEKETLLGPESYTNTEQMATTIEEVARNCHLRTTTDIKQSLAAIWRLGRNDQKTHPISPGTQACPRLRLHQDNSTLFCLHHKPSTQ